MKTVKHNDLSCTFDPKWHTYSVNGKRLKSVSKVKNQYKPPFDPDGTILQRCAARAGVPPEELKSEWNAKGEYARNLGTNVHAFFECLFLGRLELPPPMDEKAAKMFAQVAHIHEKLVAEYDILGVEHIVFSERLGIAGTVDLIGQHKGNGTITTFDYKTSKKIDTNNYGTSMLPPFNYPDSNFYEYSLQLSLYEYLMRTEGYFPEQKYQNIIVHIRENDYWFYTACDMSEELHLVFK